MALRKRPSDMSDYAQSSCEKAKKRGGKVHFYLKAISASLCFVMLACVCACGPQTQIPEESQSNSSYLAQVNSTMTHLSEDLDLFVDAVSRNDLVNMRTQADNAYKQLDALSEIEASEDYADVQKKYLEGANKLRESLDAYIDLYTQAEAGTLKGNAYDQRLKSVQESYDEGVKLLSQADEAAAAVASADSSDNKR